MTNQTSAVYFVIVEIGLGKFCVWLGFGFGFGSFSFGGVEVRSHVAQLVLKRTMFH